MLKRTLIRALRQEHAYRHKHKEAKPSETRDKIADILSIKERPVEFKDHTVPGNWEGDLILVKNKLSALGTHIERTTCYTILVHLGEQNEAKSVQIAFTKAFLSVPVKLKTLIYDQGKEMSKDLRFTIAKGIKVYSAHSPFHWE